MPQEAVAAFDNLVRRATDLQFASLLFTAEYLGVTKSVKYLLAAALAYRIFGDKRIFALNHE